MSLMTRMVDFFKVQRITAMMTSLSYGSQPLHTSDIGVSSLTDTWIVLRDVMSGPSRHRAITIVKSRGMAHSDETREFRITDRGIRLRREPAASNATRGRFRVGDTVDDTAAGAAEG